MNKILIGILLCLCALAQAEEDRIFFKDSLRTNVATLNGDDPADMDKVIGFSVILKTRDLEKMEAKIEKGEIISPKELEEYLPAKEDFAALRKFFESNGFKVTKDLTIGITVSGSLKKIEEILKTKLKVGTHDDFNRMHSGLEKPHPTQPFIYASTACSLPASLGAKVLAINGL